MNTVLVPVDFTSFSENAVKFAGYFAGKKGMDVKLLHIIEEPKSGFIPFTESKDKKDYLPDMIQTAEEHLSKLASRLLPEHVDRTWEIKQTKDSVTDEILNESCEVIVMGRRRPENQEAFWVGSTAEKVVRLSAIPVITIGELADNYTINNIAFASDFHEDEVKPVAQRVFDLAEIFDADLDLVYVQLNREYLNSKTSEEKINKFLNDLKLNEQDLNIYVADSPEEGITRYVDENKTDILCMCTHGRTGLAHFFRQSVAENISAYGSVPVLTYNINKEKIDRATQPIARKLIRKRVKESQAK